MSACSQASHAPGCTNYTGMWLLLNKGTRATPQPCPTHCPDIVSLPLAITHFQKSRQSHRIWALLMMTRMACQIHSYRIDSQSVECRTARNESRLRLLRRCALMRIAKINTSSILPSRDLHSCARRTPPLKYLENGRPRASPPPPLNPSPNPSIRLLHPQPPPSTLHRPQPSSNQTRR
jgi:hypothetical protein